MLIVMMLAMPVQASLDAGYETVQYEALVIDTGSGHVVAAVALRKERTILAVSAMPNSSNIITSGKAMITKFHGNKWKDRPAWIS